MLEILVLSYIVLSILSVCYLTHSLCFKKEKIKTLNSGFNFYFNSNGSYKTTYLILRQVSMIGTLLIGLVRSIFVNGIKGLAILFALPLLLVLIAISWFVYCYESTVAYIVN